MDLALKALRDFESEEAKRTCDKLPSQTLSLRDRDRGAAYMRGRACLCVACVFLAECKGAFRTWGLSCRRAWTSSGGRGRCRKVAGGEKQRSARCAAAEQPRGLRLCLLNEWLEAKPFAERRRLGATLQSPRRGLPLWQVLRSVRRAPRLGEEAVAAFAAARRNCVENAERRGPPSESQEAEESLVLPAEALGDFAPWSWVLEEETLTSDEEAGGSGAGCRKRETQREFLEAAAEIFDDARDEFIQVRTLRTLIHSLPFNRGVRP